MVDRKDPQISDDEEDGLSSSRNGPSFNGGYAKMSYTDTSQMLEDTSCGFGIFRGEQLQRFANKKAFVIFYGIVGCIISATYAYFNGTITTIEKRYKIPSKNTGIISVGNDISTLFLSAIVSYYAGKGHRPRWMAFGLLTVVLYCGLFALPHLLYGPGESALTLTTEYGAQFDEIKTKEILEAQKQKSLCQPLGLNNNGTSNSVCEQDEGNLMPQVIFFLAQLIGGVGCSLHYTLGVSYIDDNVKKSKTPALISFSYFLRLLGPAIGYSLASACLKLYISPSLHPTVETTDPRWLGAWWLGWLLLSSVLVLFAIMLGMFPKVLPRAAARKQLELDKQLQENTIPLPPADKPSLKDMFKTFSRLLYNPTLMFNNLASVFYFFGYMPYWIFTPKYIEIQYHQSASVSSLVTGTVALGFSALGILIAGVTISKFKPQARKMAAWNVIVGVMSVVGMIGYVFLGCASSDNILANTMDVQSGSDSVNSSVSCYSDCRCDYVTYAPVCGEDGNTYISACHAGCTDQVDAMDGGKLFTDCRCVDPVNESDKLAEILPMGTATSGPCPVDCSRPFYLFLAVMCFIKFTSSTGRVTNFLVSVRCVDDKDKPVSMGFSAMVMSLLSFIPSPIFFGAVLDSVCLVWGKTCSGKGNCWLYDSESLRYKLNILASVFVAAGTLVDVIVWYYVKDLKIFDDDEIVEKELEVVQKDEEEDLVAQK